MRSGIVGKHYIMDYENVIIHSTEILGVLMFRHEASSALSDEAIVEMILTEKF